MYYSSSVVNVYFILTYISKYFMIFAIISLNLNFIITSSPHSAATSPHAPLLNLHSQIRIEYRKQIYLAIECKKMNAVLYNGYISYFWL